MTAKTLTISIALAVLPITMSAESPPEIPVPEAPEKSITLFDGKSLDGWKVVGGNGKFKVEDGCIVGYGVNINRNTFLRTEKEYGDFDMTFEFKFDDLKGNSGVMFRAAQKEGTTGRVFGYQCEVDNTQRGWTAGIYDEARRGWLFPRKSDPAHADHRNAFTAEGRSIFKWNDWNTIRVRCKGNHIQTWLNGVKRADFVDDDSKNDTRSGFFGLQVHSGKACHVRWRNLQLTPL